jgi:two-component system sensor histidine kinase UhpB
MVLTFFASTAAVVNLALGRALAPLTVLASRLRSIADGDTGVRAPVAGPPELAGLARSFNAMAGALGESAAENARLQALMVTLQEEERADLARDLHDEFGPHLFAMKIDAAVIRDEAGRSSVVWARTTSLEASIGHIQTHVRGMLQRLRPAPGAEIDLEDAVRDQIAFWQGRRPEVDFTLAFSGEAAALDPLRRTAIHRLVQEGLNNALRHARPSRIEVFVGPDRDGVLLAEISNDGAEGSGSPPLSGTGLIGMGERVSACGGVLAAGLTGDGRRWRVTAHWPPRAAAPTRALV